MASRLIRILASGLIFNATFPLDALTAPSPVSVAAAVPAQPFNAEQLDALDAGRNRRLASAVFRLLGHLFPLLGRKISSVPSSSGICP